MGNVGKAIEEKAKRKGGRPPGTGGPTSLTRRNIQRMQQMFAVHAEEAMNTLVRIMRDDGADFAVRVKASNDILNRAYGTPVSTQVVMQITEQENGSAVDRSAIAKASTPELLALAEALAKFTAKAERENLIDITPELPPDYPKD